MKTEMLNISHFTEETILAIHKLILEMGQVDETVRNIVDASNTHWEKINLLRKHLGVLQENQKLALTLIEGIFEITKMQEKRIEELERKNH